MSETIVHKNLAVIRVADPHVFEEIRAVLPLDDFVLGTLSPTEALIDPRRTRELVSRLEQRGLTTLVRKIGV